MTGKASKDKRRKRRFSYSGYYGIVAEGVSNPAPLKTRLAKIDDISKGGVKVRHVGKPLSPGSKISIYFMEQRIQREARIVWSKTISEIEAAAGINFIKPIPMAPKIVGAFLKIFSPLL